MMRGCVPSGRSSENLRLGYAPAFEIVQADHLCLEMAGITRLRMAGETCLLFSVHGGLVVQTCQGDVVVHPNEAYLHPASSAEISLCRSPAAELYILRFRQAPQREGHAVPPPRCPRPRDCPAAGTTDPPASAADRRGPKVLRLAGGPPPPRRARAVRAGAFLARDRRRGRSGAGPGEHRLPRGCVHRGTLPRTHRHPGHRAGAAVQPRLPRACVPHGTTDVHPRGGARAADQGSPRPAAAAAHPGGRGDRRPVRVHRCRVFPPRVQARDQHDPARLSAGARLPAPDRTAAGFGGVAAGFAAGFDT